MKNFVLLFALLIACAPAAAAQDEYRKWEFFGGYSYMNFDNAAGNTNNAAVNEVFGEKESLQGFDLSITRNVHRYVGVKFDYSLHLREDNFSISAAPGRDAAAGTIDTTVQNYLFGVQFQNNLKDGPRLRPFAHALAGFAVEKIDLDSPQLQTVFGVNDFHVNETSFAAALGGGVDLKVTKRIDARLAQIDWNIIRRGDQQFQSFPAGQNLVLPNTRQDNFRFSIGIVVH
jgi:opacity protein-like surface antigen